MSTHHYSHLLSPGRIGAMELRNRMIVTAMGVNLAEADGTSAVKDNDMVTVAGLLTQCKQKPTRAGTGLMGYAVLEGITGSVEAVLFPRTLQQVGGLFVDDAAVLTLAFKFVHDDVVEFKAWREKNQHKE